MASLATIQKQQDSPNQPNLISWEVFKKKYLTREDNYKYEWVNGKVEKTLRFEYPKKGEQPESKKHTMYESQFYILDNLLEFFNANKLKHNISGQLIPEGDTFFKGKHRRPDIAFFTKQQIRAAKNASLTIPPQFIIEIISNNDQANLVQEKMVNYRDAKVPIVWLIFPKLKQVQIYHGKKSQIYEKAELCSAEPIIKGFVLSVNDIFQ